MTYWNLAFDAAAMLFLLLIFVWYFNEKRIPLRSHKAFLLLLTATFLATGFEILATLMARHQDVVGYNAFYSVLTLQTLAVNMVPVAFSYYLLLLSHVDVKRHKALRMLYTVCIAVDLIIIALNPFLGWACTFQNDIYKVNYAGMVMYFIDVVMVGICIYTLVHSRRNFMFLRLGPLSFNILCGVAACIGQIFFYIPLLNLTLAMICMTLFYYQQNAGTVTDIVTKQFNRRFMGEYIQSKFIEGKAFGVIVVAMDDFKFVNKTYGVENGDHLLCQTGHFLENLKGMKTVFRFGSDQFCVVVEKDMDCMEELGSRIQERFHHPWYDETQTPIMMSATICCIACPGEAQNYGELIGVIDYSMSIAKKTRKGLITRAGEIDLDKIRQDKAIEKAVKLAIDRDELMVYYQPIFSVTKGVYNSAEALVRLHDDELGWVSPEDFIPIAEKNGLIVEMGELILEKVCRFIHDFRLGETTVEYIEVNISPVQLMQADFAERVKAIMEKYDVAPHQVNLEITETATMNSASSVRENIMRLVDYGISFSLDDYGSGNANIDYINHMPFKIIKLDKYIIWDSFKNSKAGITLEYTIRMLNALELYIVAEGVETEDMRAQLAEYGCHYMQGWYYSKAVPDVEFVRLLEAQA